MRLVEAGHGAMRRSIGKGVRQRARMLASWPTASAHSVVPAHRPGSVRLSLVSLIPVTEALFNLA